MRPLPQDQRSQPAAGEAQQAAGESRRVSLVTLSLRTGADAELLTRFYKDGSVQRWMSVEGMARGMKKVSRWRVD